MSIAWLMMGSSIMIWFCSDSDYLYLGLQALCRFAATMATALCLDLERLCRFFERMPFRWTPALSLVATFGHHTLSV